MASAGMLHRGRNTGPESGDEVQRSLELLDSVLSEFEEVDRVSIGGGVVVDVPNSGAIGGVTTASVTPDDDSPSLGGHQSEDDGYMSMNGRRTKFALSFRPTEEKGEPILAAENQSNNISPSSNISVSKTTSLELETNDESLSPPPPSEAERIICTLLPKVSPSNTSKKFISNESQEPLRNFQEEFSIQSEKGTHSSTQTTLPKTRHQRPYGWEKEAEIIGNSASHVQCKFSSLQHGSHQPINSTSQSWLPPRQKKDDLTTKTNITPSKKSPIIELPKKPFPLTSSFSIENDFVLGNMPYNEHPVTIYPGANVPYTKQLNSPTFGLPKGSPLSTSYSAKSSINSDAKLSAKKENCSDGEMLSPTNKVPPRTLAGSIERHREVCRRASDNNSASPVKNQTNEIHIDEDHFSDDSLEESFPPPPPLTLTPSKRSSIAWEVSLDGDDPLLTPGSTKVVGRRRRKSGDQSNSSTNSIPQRVEEWISENQGEYWPPPPMQCSTEDEIASPFSDTNSDQLPIPEDITEVNATGTYIIRRGKKDRKNIPSFDKKSHKNNSQSSRRNENDSSNKIIDRDQSIDGSSLSISGISTSGSHNSVSSLNSRLSSDLSIPHSRYSIDFNSRFSRELNTPNSRFSIDLCLPQSNSIKKELSSPKSRLSLDLNNGQDKYYAKDFFNGSPRNKKLDDKKLEINLCSMNKNVVPNKLSPQNRFTDFKKYSCTFDNIQSLMKEGVETAICGPQFDETSNDLEIVPPSVVRVVSLPTLNAETDAQAARQILTTTVEEEEDFESPSQSSEDNSPLKKIENNISALLSQGRDQQYNQYLPKDWDIHKDEYCNNQLDVPPASNVTFNSGERHKRNEIQKSSSHNEIPNKRLLDYHRDKSSKRNGIHKSLSSKDMPVALNRQMSSSESTGSSGGDFAVHVQIVEHAFKPHLHDFGPLPNSPGSPQFPPLPPSPVQEDDDEYSEILQPLEKIHLAKSKDVLPSHKSDMYLRSLEGPVIPPHRELTTNSLKTRSMDTSFCKNRRNNNSNKSLSADRRTLPSDIGVISGRRRTFQRQRGGREDGSGGSGLQTSASLPETPVFGRGIDVPRTPHRRTTDGPRISSTMNSIQTMSGSSTVGGYGRGTNSMERAIAGAELLRLAGGPARGWYPKQRHRPASIEHLERLPLSASVNQHTGPWDSSRKPLTLPPNLTPKFFHKSPREALRRVTSLLIRKGNSSKDQGKKEKQAVSPAARSANGEETAQKQRKGFFKSFWKRSRHYSLEHP